MDRKQVVVAGVCATVAEYEHCKASLQPQVEQKLKGRKVFYWSDERLAIAIVHAGPGKVQCASATQLVIDEFAPCLIVDIGAAGSLIETNEIGCVICGQYCYEYDICSLEQFPLMAQDLTTATLVIKASAGQRAILSEFSHYIGNAGVVPGMRMGNIVSGEQNVTDTVVRERLREAFHAVACDWETAAVLKTATLNGVDSLSFRVITDKADAKMLDDYALNRDRALGKLGGLLKTFLCDGWVCKLLAVQEQMS